MEFLPNEAMANKIFDALPKRADNWREMMATMAMVAIQVFMAGSKEKGSKFEMFMAFPECEIRKTKGYKITIVEMDENENGGIQYG